MKPSIFSREMLFSGPALLLALALFALALHFSLNGYYGYQRDELYFIACGEHLDWGYVDIGPLAMWLGRLSREVMGESLFALRFFPAVAAALTILLTGLLARELRGGRFAQAVAGLAVLIAPVWLESGNILALSSFEPLFWILAAFLVVRILKTGNSQLWLWVGVTAGFGLLNKPSMLFWGLGLVVGLLLTPHRKQLADKWLWLGGLIAILIALPYILWQIPRHWPTVQFLVGMNQTVMARISRIEFVAGQILYIHPFNVPIWLAGLWYYLRSREGKPYRPLGWIFVTVFLVLIILKSKVYYLAPAYPMLLAAGACAIENWIRSRGLAWPRVAIPAALAAGGIMIAPVALPILPIDKAEAYINAATFGALANVYEVTGTFHDQFGWENQVATVAKVYHALPPEDRKDCVIFATNFGRAGAVDFYGKAYGLPQVYSTHQNYYFWGPPKTAGSVTIVVGGKLEDLQMAFDDVRVAATIICKECVPFENNVPVFLCRNQKLPFETIWDMLKPRAFLNG